MDTVALKPKLSRLKLSGILDTLSSRLDQAQSEKWSYSHFLDFLLSDEVERRDHKQLLRRLLKSELDPEKTLQSFDFTFNPKIHEPTIRELATCGFLEKKECLLLLGPSGVGKTHAVKAIGHEACRRSYQVLFRTAQKLLAELQSDSAERAQRALYHAVHVDLLIVDDFAFRKLDQKEAELLYVLAEEQLGRASTVLTSNRPTEDWYAIFPDSVVGGAILDRMVSAAIKIIATTGRSYRKEVMGAGKRESKAAS